MIMSIMDTENVIVPGPFSDNFIFHSRSYRSTLEELLNFCMQELSITPRLTTSIRYRSVSTSTDNPMTPTSTSTQTMGPISQRELSNFGIS